ncbi:iron-sulfur cluster biosynthesis protein, putative [Bodo saltans]|uniref:Iron-sulfur cluster biosynthesis protein, putative n=1 Tax=Bodo saltans TaxID=75058 RepID=A0A0S4JDK9_BODSA|nr:iron-sulfur cluster biosynthesis protein, putative [Bodo saltans]|eukprot:CUG86434.1 iron-sulfur cluster biosynthesis protein, putative [Bodo saltans]
MLRISTRRFCAATAATAATIASPQSHSPVPREFKGSALPVDYLTANSEAAKKIYHNNFTISDRCWDRVHSKNQLESVSNNDRFLRLAVESGGCHGYMYKFQFDDALDQEDDVMFFEDELRDTTSAPSSEGDAASSSSSSSSTTIPAVVVVDKSTAECMSKAVLDYHMELKGSAFVVVGNEKVDHLCACAMSFSVRK